MNNTEPPPAFIQAMQLDGTVLILSSFILLLLLLSALFSGAESAYFSLSPKDTEAMAVNTTKNENKILTLLRHPKELLAALLIANNFVNVGIIILSSYLINYYFPMADNYLRFFLEVIGITLVILIWGEVIPKIFAVKNAPFVTKLMSTPILIIKKTPPFSFLVRALVKSSRLFDQTNKGKVNLSSSDLEQAVAITKEESLDDEHNILEGIVKFGKTEASQIMKPRIEVSAVDAEMKFSEIKAFILDCGYSRIPVYKETADRVIGILYIKDLLPFLNQNDQFNWLSTLRRPFFIPENKKINDLLQEFKTKKMHLSIVVDEYGGASGIVTLEDILEEIVGEITDEFDEEEMVYSRIDDGVYIFEGRTSLMDFYKASKIEPEAFEKIKGEAETIGGFVIEQAGRIPKNNEFIEVEKCKIIVESSDKRRIKTLKVITNNHA